MPRKQRFKPSRKPKPVVVNEDTGMTRSEPNSPAINENVAARESLPARDMESVSEAGPPPR